MQFKQLFVVGVIIIIVAVTLNLRSAYAHGCQAQGGCCSVGGACVEISANSPIYMMFAVVGLGGLTMFVFYGRSEQRQRLGAIFNIFG